MCLGCKLINHMSYCANIISYPNLQIPIASILPLSLVPSLPQVVMIQCQYIHITTPTLYIILFLSHVSCRSSFAELLFSGNHFKIFLTNSRNCLLSSPWGFSSLFEAGPRNFSEATRLPYNNQCHVYYYIIVTDPV